MVKKLSQRPRFLKIIPPLDNSIVVKGDEIALNNPWHYHPEIELLYCISGKGTNFVGNSIRSIEEGELLLFGENLPHTRQRDHSYYKENPGLQPKTIVVQFRYDFLGKDFFSVNEFAHVRQLLIRATRGLKFSGKTKDAVASQLQTMRTSTGAASIIQLLSILDALASTNEFEFLNSEHYESNAHEPTFQKLNKVYLYTIENFRNKITLEDVAALTNHSPAAFCRYFKSRTRKSYFQYLTEVRISYACEKLREGNLDVTRAAYASGFNNLSHFNKQFKSIMHVTPSEYQEQSYRKVPQLSG